MAVPSNLTEAGDTIFALSSGALPSAIAVIRISGPASLGVMQHLAGVAPEPRQAVLRTLRDGDEVVDQGLALWFPGPRTVTGEDVAEFHVHGSRAVVQRCFDALHALGLRMAEPGEFTRRALLGGKMNLDSVEGLADLLSAETESQRRDAIRRQRGAIPRQLERWRNGLIDASAQLEAMIDYDGEDDVAGGELRIARDLRLVLQEIEKTLARAPATPLYDGIRIAIAGPPNAGKSTLLNALVGHDAAIVSDRAGTTRDAIECRVAIGGIPFVVVDTAGLRDSDDEIERIGIARAREEHERAQIIIDLAAAEHDARRIAVSAKADIAVPRPGTLGVSALSGDGMAALHDRLVGMARTLLPIESEIRFQRRHYDALEQVRHELSLVSKLSDLVLSAEHIRMAVAELDQVLDGNGTEDMLDALFKRFCLGK